MLGRRAAVFVLSVAFVSASCSSDSSGPSTETPGFDVTVTSPSGATLGTTQTLAVEIESTTYQGSITLDLEGAPADWVVTFSPSATVSVTAGGTTAVAIQIQIPSDGTSAPSGRALTVTASSASDVVEEDTSLAVANEYVLSIVGGQGAHWGPMQNATVTLKAGTLLRIHNAHNDNHVVHAENAIGMPHQASPGTAPGASYSATVTEGEDSIYCHSHGPDDDAVHFTVVP